PVADPEGRVTLYLAAHLPRLRPPLETVRLKADTTTVRGVRLQADPTAAGRVRLPLDEARGKQPDHDSRHEKILECLRARGASFFAPLHAAVGGGYPAETVDALWTLVWNGLVTNDTFHALRAFTRVRTARRRAKRMEVSAFRSRRLSPPSAEGRWSLVPRVDVLPVGRPARHREATKWAAAVAPQI